MSSLPRSQFKNRKVAVRRMRQATSTVTALARRIEQIIKDVPDRMPPIARSIYLLEAELLHALTGWVDADCPEEFTFSVTAPTKEGSSVLEITVPASALWDPAWRLGQAPNKVRCVIHPVIKKVVQEKPRQGAPK